MYMEMFLCFHVDFLLQTCKGHVHVATVYTCNTHSPPPPPTLYMYDPLQVSEGESPETALDCGLIKGHAYCVTDTRTVS